MKTRKIARAKKKAENRKKALEMLQDEIDKKEEGGEGADGGEEGKKASADLENGGRASKKLVSGSAKSASTDNPVAAFDPEEFAKEMDEKNKKEDWKKKALSNLDRLAPATAKSTTNATQEEKKAEESKQEDDDDDDKGSDGELEI